ncbi:7-cyano-7-deazaguanine synthase QueC [Thermospira aquatica]|uniref:7-cyano-7-deazaguanine synthase n=1 Tax=Thermospira aquatica TaxID=2828656 RepID=A0AAX3BBE1_9SPIR|nr:7-cyano-7-deazaguanine synthase QueC [Thermospira aquatica]URA09591.1 7-cyano-7-deazaguanine synthase QueC [Thermospira aquatica]
MGSSVVLLSGGLDSVVNFKKALDEKGVRLVLFFDYGQKAYKREKEAITKIARRYDVPFQIIRLDFMRDFSTGLTRGRIPLLSQKDLEDSLTTEKSASAVWVPNRNGVFIEIAAAIAENVGASSVVVGFNREEATTFPDNSSDYLDALNIALHYSTRGKVKLSCYTLTMSKKEIYAFGKDIVAPLDLVWSCYQGGRKMCGKCESCQRLKRAMGTDRSWFETEHFWGGFAQ